MGIRKTEMRDFDRVMEIYYMAQERMIENGNPTQWGHFYPTEEMILDDIEKSISYVIENDGIIVGVFMIREGDDPTYSYIEDGSWINDEPYVTIHRIASDGKTHGIFRMVSDFCKLLSVSVRVDTHYDNKIMQRCIVSNGFERCGIIYVDDGTPRIAYQWVKS